MTTWPPYPDFDPGPASDTLPAPWPAIARHQRRVAGETQAGPPPVWALAVDVWRGGLWLWRSWDPAKADDLDDWARRTWGEDAPLNHDGGPWGGIPGVRVADWPIPSLAALSDPLGLDAISDTLTALLAIGQYPSAPTQANVPGGPALAQRLRASPWPWLILRLQAGDVTVRALIGRAANVASQQPNEPGRVWMTASLIERPSLKLQATLEPCSGRFSVERGSADDPAWVRKVLRLAKATCHITGRPAQRIAGGLTWRLTDQPLNLVIEQEAA